MTSIGLHLRNDTKKQLQLKLPIHKISPNYLKLETVEKIIQGSYQLTLSAASKKRILDCRKYLDKKLKNSDELIYGINTGFGSLCNVEIEGDDLEQLQTNLVMSHACGTGDEVPAEVLRLILLLKIQSLSYGHSAISLEVVERLIHFYNEDVLPVVYQQGSLGASGDLAPLAHLSLPLIGLGEVNWKGKRMKGATALKKMGLKPIRLQSKEGLALLNGTQFSTAYATWAMIQSRRLLQLANFTAAVSIDAFDCRMSPYDERIHKARPHQGQLATAKFIRKILATSPIAKSKKTSVQDPYAFRCVPQVHGASHDAIHYVENVVLTEMNSVTDNPNIFADSDGIISGGNFHAQPIALALDFLAIALSELGSISERRLYQLISGQRGLPAFLTEHPGLQSGLMIAQYTAASIASQNKQLCTPASVDSIVSCNGQEDHVSMAANAATKLYKVVENLERLLAIELMAGAQAMHFRRPQRSSKKIEIILAKYRKVVPVLLEDRVLSEDIHATIEFVKSFKI